MKLKKIHIKNYKAFKDATFELNDGLNVIIGENGVGKSTLFEVLALVRELSRYDYRERNNVVGEFGGYSNLHFSGNKQKISIDFHFEALKYNQLFESVKSFVLTISIDKKEIDINLSNIDYHKVNFLIQEEVKKPSLKSLKDFYSIAPLGIITECHNYFLKNLICIPQLNALRELASIGSKIKDLESGKNLATLIYEETRNNPEKLELLREKVRKFIPEIKSFETVKTEDDRVLLKINSAKFIDPFYSKVLSDGTLKLFYYIILLNREVSPPLLCIEEPETYLYQGILYDLAEEFRGYTERTGKQVIITTHSPDFVNALYIDELTWIKKVNGESTFHRAIEDERVKLLHEKGDQLGYLWQEGSILYPKK